MANDFELKINRYALQKFIQQEMTKKAKEFQSAADDIWRRYNGRSVAMVRAAIKRNRAFRNSPLSNKDINDMAKAIASGTRVQVRLQ
jgi:hypothetical protein